MFETSDKLTRIGEARRVTLRLVDHAHYLLDIHENNAIVLFSDVLSKQIPKSYAANAFNSFREAMHQIEVVRLCALWDAAHLDHESIPTVIELIDDDDVIAVLAQEECARHKGASTPLDDGQFKDDAEKKAVAAAIEEKQNEFADERKAQAMVELKAIIKEARDLRKSERLKSLRNLRDKHLAHYLVESRAEKAGAVIESARYGDERIVLETSLKVIETLYCWVNGVGISFEQSRAIDRKCAEALWNACKFSI